jgi:hypothetical protein
MHEATQWLGAIARAINASITNNAGSRDTSHRNSRRAVAVIDPPAVIAIARPVAISVGIHDRRSGSGHLRF